ncbi:hypothetical protein BaRGS_00014906 [Batillaria attramentaria]|uniref:Uncharacterized protein n=1 Tax=Batillaria attramentaria TaxID=370345 RepID=A0ABD0L3R9_9CAEN
MAESKDEEYGACESRFRASVGRALLGLLCMLECRLRLTGDHHRRQSARLFVNSAVADVCGYSTTTGGANGGK